MASDPRVDEYLATLPAEQAALLGRVRALVARVVPDAVETISYGMPAFKTQGHFLVSYAGWKRHCSIYPLTDTFLRAHERDLEGYGRTKGSLHFTAEKPVPDSILEELVRARITDLDAGER